MKNNLFEKCVEWKLMKDGSYQCHCKRGLWSVSGPTKKAVMAEAIHYWMQYFHDGEYHSILTNPAVHGGGK